MSAAELLLFTHAILDLRALIANVPPDKAATLGAQFNDQVERYALAVREHLTTAIPSPLAARLEAVLIAVAWAANDLEPLLAFKAPEAATPGVLVDADGWRTLRETLAEWKALTDRIAASVAHEGRSAADEVKAP